MVLFGFFKKKPDSLIGEILDQRYKITKRLGEGGFGDTYLAIDTRSKIQQSRVVKHLHPKDVPSNERAYLLPKLREMFEREKTVLETLGEEHPYKQIPRMIDHFDQWDEFFYVQEFVDGQTLDDRGDGEMSPRSEADVRQLLIEILEVLAFVHQRRVVHRDLKPANIMRRSKDRRIVLIDFGAVKDLSRISVNRNNQRNSSLIIGTPAYMPPEQQNGEPQLASDVYAIGMIGIQALTGYVPLTFVNRQTLALDWLGFADVSQEFADILNRMISYRPIDRYASAVEALQAIQNIKSSPVQFNPPRPPKVTIDDPFAQPAKPISVYEPTVVARPNKPDINQKTERVEAERRKQKLLEQQREQEKVRERERQEQIQAQREVEKQARIKSQREKEAAERLAEAKRRELFVDLGNGVTLELVRVPAGKFMMGSDEYENEKPIHQVQLKEFLIGKYAVTNAQWQAVMKTMGSANCDKKFQGDLQPVVSVSWHEAREFCNKIQQLTGRTARLPTEAEWEYAAIGANQSKRFTYSGSNNIDEVGWYGEDYSEGSTHPVGQKNKNELGIYDMSGNVWEWCLDEWHKSYADKPENLKKQGNQAWGGLNVDDNDNRYCLLRGGSWDDYARLCRAAYRVRINARLQDCYIGFRLLIASSS
jgi:formylglycine-generating enzyme required for sulfatase activity/tRNA A-37 threonylcarbamoyl transferase component Bud32